MDRRRLREIIQDGLSGIFYIRSLKNNMDFKKNQRGQRIKEKPYALHKTNPEQIIK
jgi:hypothetical protein